MSSLEGNRGRGGYDGVPDGGDSDEARVALVAAFCLLRRRAGGIYAIAICSWVRDRIVVTYAEY